jgi:hypothetical protein
VTRPDAAENCQFTGSRAACRRTFSIGKGSISIRSGDLSEISCYAFSTLRGQSGAKPIDSQQPDQAMARGLQVLAYSLLNRNQEDCMKANLPSELLSLQLPLRIRIG